MQVLMFCKLGLKMPIHSPKIGVLGRQNRERGDVMLMPPMNSFLLLGVVTSVPLLAAID